LIQPHRRHFRHPRQPSLIMLLLCGLSRASSKMSPKMSSKMSPKMSPKMSSRRRRGDAKYCVSTSNNAVVAEGVAFVETQYFASHCVSLRLHVDYGVCEHIPALSLLRRRSALAITKGCRGRRRKRRR
jgi:hypothetical protein